MEPTVPLCQFAVVRLNSQGGHTFGKWHETREVAEQEAERLARKEFPATFAVLKAVGVVGPDTSLVWRRL